jgi:CHAT domain-containing protein/Tfp pilus assembly protein PilF
LILRLPAPPTASAVAFQPTAQGAVQRSGLSMELPCHEMAYSLRQRIATCQSFLAMQQERGDVAGAGATLNNLGLVYQEQGKYAEAAQVYQQALTLHRQLGLLDRASASLTNLGTIYQQLGQYPQALDSYQQALSGYQTLNNQDYIGRTLNNMGTLHRQLGQPEQALALYQQALPVAEKSGDRAATANLWHNLGLLHHQAKRYSQALENYQQALAIRQETGDRSGAGSTLNNLGLVYQDLGQPQQGLAQLQAAQEIFQATGNHNQLGNVWDSQGTVYRALNQPGLALAAYQRAIALTQQTGDTSLNAEILANTGALFAEQQQPALAIVFYKQSVQLTESIRQSLRRLPQPQQEAYTQTVASTYRALADLLLKQDRVLEAQQVLELLKLQELQDYLRTVRGSVPSVEFLRPEAQILQTYNALQQGAVQVGQELAQLRQIPANQRTPEQQRRISQLVQLEEDLTRQFNQFASSPDVVALVQQLSPRTLRQTVDLADLVDLRRDLARWNAVLLYPLILDDRLELILTTPNAAPLRRTVKVSKAELNATILAFRQALQSPSKNVKAPAQKLYSWLIQPLEADLKQAKFQTIIYAPDGQLRYIPLAALHDGTQWLTQRYRVNHITAKSLTKFDAASKSALDVSSVQQYMVVAGAFSDVSQRYAVALGERSQDFQGLPYAKTEISNLAQRLPNTTQFIDQAFSLVNLKPRLNESRIVHLATHAAFIPGAPENSFILFGNGDRATLTDIANWSLQNVDLVVLSACETGLGGQLGNGEEILGLGYQFQTSGAKATVASLWSVQDDGTAILMDAFYKHLQQGLPMAEALRQAQMDLIAHPNYSRPLYWAPFILIGNGL